MGFIGYRAGHDHRSNPSVRIFMECYDGHSSPAGKHLAEAAEAVSYTYAVDVIFPQGRPPCRLKGVEDVLSLKKFYKVVSSLEERAREHGNPRQAPLDSVEGLLEHLRYTRNARDLEGTKTIRRSASERAGDGGWLAIDSR